MLKPEQVQAALDAIADNNTEAAMELLRDILTQISTGEDATSESESESEDALASEGGEPPENAPEKDKAEELASVALGRLVQLSGKSGFGEAVAFYEDLKSRSDKIAAEQKKLDDDARQDLVGQLVKLGAEVPATAWQDDDRKVLAPRLAKEPVSDLRKRVHALAASKGQRVVEVRPPTKGGPEDNTKTRRSLSKTEREYCDREKISTDEFFERLEKVVRRTA